jgi:hypothetical protein
MVFRFRLQNLNLKRPENLTKSQKAQFTSILNSLQSLKNSCPGGNVRFGKTPEVTYEATIILDKLLKFVDENGRQLIPGSHPIYNGLDELIYLSAHVNQRRQVYHNNPFNTLNAHIKALKEYDLLRQSTS